MAKNGEGIYIYIYIYIYMCVCVFPKLNSGQQGLLTIVAYVPGVTLRYMYMDKLRKWACLVTRGFAIK